MKRSNISTLLFAIPAMLLIQQATFAQYVIAPNGNDNNDGVTQPWATLGPISFKLVNGLITPSQTMANGLSICFMSGTYYFNQPYGIVGVGSSAHPITISPCAGQTGPVTITDVPTGFPLSGGMNYLLTIGGTGIPPYNQVTPYPLLAYSSYIVINGINFVNHIGPAILVGTQLPPPGPFYTSHITIENCTFQNMNTQNQFNGIGPVVAAWSTTHFQFLNNTMIDAGVTPPIGGWSSQQIAMGMNEQQCCEHLQLGSTSYSRIDGNKLIGAGHGSITLGTYNFNGPSNVGQAPDYNVIQNNIVEPLWGDGISLNGNSQYNIVQNNQISYAGTSTAYGKVGIYVSGPQNIVRRNVVTYSGLDLFDPLGPNGVPLYGGPYSQDGIKVVSFLCSGCGFWDTGNHVANGNRIYNNDFYRNEGPGAELVSAQDQPLANNLFVNNIFYGNNQLGGSSAATLFFNTYNSPDIQWSAFPNGNDFISNIIAHADGNDNLTGIGNTLVEYDTHSSTLDWPLSSVPNGLSGNMEANPGFVNAAKNNFQLQSGSVAIDHGAPLTTTTAAGTQVTVVPVADASFFSEGACDTNPPASPSTPDCVLQTGDLIRIGNGAAVAVTALNRSANTITVSAPVSFAANTGVFTNYLGAAPDLGAFESNVQTPTTFTTYLGNYGSGLASYHGSSTVLQLRGYDPAGIFQINYLETVLRTAANQDEYYLYVMNGGSSGTFTFHILGNTSSAPWPYLTLNPNGVTTQLSTPITLGALTVTAYRCAYVGNELQVDLTITRSGGNFADQIVIYGSSTSNQPSTPWGVSSGQWSNP